MDRVKIAIVVARARNGVIGRAGGLPWRLKSDMAHFKAVTMGKPIIMGRNTWESLPRKPLPGRLNIVVSRNTDYVAEGAVIAASIEQALKIAKDDATKKAVDEICIIGGAQIYEIAMPYADRIYLTEVDADVAGDASLSIDLSNWLAIDCLEHNQSEENQYGFCTKTLLPIPKEDG